ncbi:MAG: ATP-grasp domain-containing protein [Treponema sp.]|nr:ATP-grasp domain-containing protein [Treponema sp.]
MQEKIIILGAGVMQGPAIRIAKELGFFTIVLDGNSAAVNAGMADQFEQIDLKDKEGIEVFARSLQNSGNLGVMTAGTDFSATVAWVAERLGLPGIPYEAALNASDKGRMRACFKQAGLPSPVFTTITSAGELENTTLPALFPLVIKPVDNMGGRGCRRVNSMEEYHEATADALRFSRSGRAIVEAYMDGPEFSVDAIVYHGEITICGLADRHIYFPPFFIEMGHTMPTSFAPEHQEAILETFCAGVHALGLTGSENIGAAKGDIKLTPQGPMIGEIAARLSGGYMSGWTYPYASGVEPIRAAILAAMGRKPDGLVPFKTWTCAERAFISIPGTIKTITGIEAARRHPHVQDLFLRIAEGDKVSFPENNVSKCGNIISAAPDHAAAVESAETAARSILIRLDPADEETADFLFLPRSEELGEGNEGYCPFPPNAFTLPADLKVALASIPETFLSPSVSSESPCLCVKNLRIISFPAFTASNLKDYAGRTVEESLQVVREITGLPLPEITEENAKSSDNKSSVLGKSFWTALVRGGYQGAVYFIDLLGGETWKNTGLSNP